VGDSGVGGDGRGGDGGVGGGGGGRGAGGGLRRRVEEREFLIWVKSVLLVSSFPNRPTATNRPAVTILSLFLKSVRLVYA
jgi:hypothetical protein